MGENLTRNKTEQTKRKENTCGVEMGTNPIAPHQEQNVEQ